MIFSYRPLLALVAPLAALAFGAGCSVPLSLDYEPTQNTCDDGNECGAGSACVGTIVGENVCATTERADLGAVVLDVRTTTNGANSFVFDKQLVVDGQSETGLSNYLELSLPRVIPVRGKLLVPLSTVASETCRATDGSVPVSVLFHGLGRNGEPSSLLTDIAAASEMDGNIGSQSAVAFTANVPIGTYDVYVTPIATPECPLPAPPTLIRDFTLTPDMTSNEVTFGSAADDSGYAVLSGAVETKAGANLEGWVLEVVDPIYGHPVSRPTMLGLASAEVVAFEGLQYSSVTSPILRLHDPTGNLVIHWDLNTLDFDLDNVVVLPIQDLDTTPVSVNATIIDSEGALVPFAQVVIQSDTLTGSNQQIAQYRFASESDSAGRIAASLIPGTYAVWIVPSTPELPSLFAEWNITADAGGSGLGFQLPPQPVLEGTISDPSENPLPYVPVVARPPRAERTTYAELTHFRPIQQEDQASVVLNRQFTGTTEVDGFFSLGVDKGTKGLMDVLVQTPSDTTYPWLVLPSVLIQDTTDLPKLDLGDNKIPYPAIAHGRIVDSNGSPVGFAVVRAWVTPSAEDSRLLQVGETQTDADGNFVLALPPSITGAALGK